MRALPRRLKIEAIKQVTETCKPVADVADVAQCLGILVHRLYAWIKLYSKPQDTAQLVTLFALSNLWMARRHLLSNVGEVRL
nr:transposase [Pseudomonas oligotrophica]